MKTHLTRNKTLPAATQAGLTMVEMMVTVAIFVMVVTAFISANIFGLRYDQLVCSKLGASEQSRRSFEDLTSDIRASKIWRIGSGSQTTFNAVSNATLMVGNALQLNLTTDTNVFVRYYFDTNGPTTQPNGRLCRITSAGQFTVCAQYLTNASGTSMVFQAQNYLGTGVLSDYQYKYVIDTLMEFYQYQFPKTVVGPGYYYDYYRIDLKAASHSPN
ncbi:MAG TPA: prepilin-type N-terminal cleavage/methylation domain-containing protein [Candidatus Acidoferrum sp.]|jgi:prepilin-type N-terminal cleavage/methylation domain-containing protein|nr:prepilin-type N-terminal cleavage/methylation domain-containing protein [Candidatus Acidoferrum sp.]